jgi:hypothetical protein
MRHASVTVICLMLVGCSGSSGGFCADRQTLMTQLTPCASRGIVLNSLPLARCQSVYNGSSCTATDRARLDAVGTCDNALGNCNPSDAGAFYDAFVSCLSPNADAGIEIGGVSAGCTQALEAAADGGQ